MTDYIHPILFSGRYQVVALTREEHFDPAEITGYMVTSSDGTPLRHEPGLEQARMWMEKLIEEENAQRPVPEREIAGGMKKRIGPATSI